MALVLPRPNASDSVMDTTNSFAATSALSGRSGRTLAPRRGPSIARHELFAVGGDTNSKLQGSKVFVSHWPTAGLAEHLEASQELAASADRTAIWVLQSQNPRVGMDFSTRLV